MGRLLVRKGNKLEYKFAANWQLYPGENEPSLSKIRAGMKTPGLMDIGKLKYRNLGTSVNENDSK